MKSKSQLYLESKERGQDGMPIPSVSSTMRNSVSNWRKQTLAMEVEEGLFKDGSRSQEGEAIRVMGSHTKLGQQSAPSYATRSGSGDVNMVTPEAYSPLWLNSNISLPRDRSTINAWCRAFFTLNPLVHNAISLHSTYPISKLNIKCKDKKAEKFFNDMSEEIDLMNICVQIAQEYFLLGEAFPYSEYDPNHGKWSRIIIQNPDYMVVNRTVIPNEPQLFLRPDENLKKIILSNRPKDVEQRQRLDPNIIESVRRNQVIPFNNWNISHLARKISPYELRGTGLPVCCFRSLMLLDRLKESKYAQAERMINPLTLVNIGSADFKPTREHLDAWRMIFEQAQSNKDYKIFTTDAVTVTPIGTGSAIYGINEDVVQLTKEIYTGLQVPSVLMDGGADTSYANGGVALDVLRQRYMVFRNMLSNWLRTKIFAPISQIQEFFEIIDGKKQLIIPEIEWNHMSLFDTSEYIATLVTLTTKGEGAPRGSLHTLHRSLGLDSEDEIRHIRKEMIQEVILEQEKKALAAMSLNELRALGDDEDIPEPTEEEAQKVPGEEGADAGGMPGMPDLGGMGGAPPPPPDAGPPPEAPPAAPPPAP